MNPSMHLRPQTSLDPAVLTEDQARQLIELKKRGIRPVQGGEVMTPRRALRKATVTTTSAAGAMLDPAAATKLWRVLQEKANFPLRQVTRERDAGEVTKIISGRRLIRRAVENDDDGYRAEPAFASMPYVAQKIRLPWEITEDTLHGNIEREQFERTVEAEMTDVWARDMEDLGFNGDTAAGAGPDQAFLQIDDGWLKQITASGDAHNVDGAAINAGVTSKAHFFAAAQAMPNKWRQQGDLKWVMSPARYLDWVEYLTDRATAAGDAALGASGDPVNRPLGYEIVQVPFLPDSIILLTNPKNLVRVVTWEIRRRKVTGETDWDLAIKDKRGYVYFIKADHIVDEFDAVVRVHGLVAPA